ncbi:MAG: tetratricopeptide repeat protein [Acidimicrobiales bacterium]
MSPTTHPLGGPADATSSHPDRWRLDDERDFLRRSLEDAAAEHAAGDLSDDDYRVLRARDEGRLAEVEGALGALDTTTAAPPGPGGGTDRPPGGAPGGPVAAGGPEEGAASGRGRRRRWYAVVGVAALVAAVALVVVQLSAPRLPGQTLTGGIKLTGTQLENQQLAEAAADEQGGDLSGAITLYGRVLAEDPDQPDALAEFGWIEWETGANPAVRRGGETLVQRAVALAPGYYPGHLYLGTIETLSGSDPAAVRQFEAFLAADPPAAKVAAAAGYIRRAFGAAHRPVPAGLPATGAAPATSTP